MNRKNFIKTSALGGLSLTVLPHLSFTLQEESFSKELLIGKDASEMIGVNFKMHQKAYSSFIKMQSRAYKEKISIKVVSAYRSFEKQKQIFENKYSKFTSEGMTPQQAISKIIEYSTIPGTSRHHWGTDVDIYDGSVSQPASILEEENYLDEGAYVKMKKWLDKHAKSYGFVEVYTNKPNRKGFKYEPWHFSYAPLAKPMLAAYKKIDIKTMLTEENIKGNEYFSDEFLNQYRSENILDINPELI